MAWAPSPAPRSTTAGVVAPAVRDPCISVSPLASVLTGGLIAGTFDIVYACSFWAIRRAVPPRRILQSVAAGLLGQASFSGGAFTAALGLALHYLIALSMAAAYYLVARRWPLLRQRPCLCGAAYGLLLYGVMN
jgi:predicted ABC-type sugar transport system permease subunit